MNDETITVQFGDMTVTVRPKVNERLREQVENMAHDQCELRNLVDRLQAKIRGLEGDRETLQDDLTGARALHDNAREACERLTHERDGLAYQNVELVADRERLNMEVANCMSLNERIARDLQLAQCQIATLERKLAEPYQEAFEAMMAFVVQCQKLVASADVTINHREGQEEFDEAYRLAWKKLKEAQAKAKEGPPAKTWGLADKPGFADTFDALVSLVDRLDRYGQRSGLLERTVDGGTMQTFLLAKRLTDTLLARGA
jgi:chromosome segregation ATPase